MIEYIENIILPYINGWRSQIEDESRSALVIMDNFKGQTTPAVNKLLEDNNIQVSLLPANTTDRLQPMDLSVNKPVKAFLKNKFQEWYCEQISKQLEGLSEKDMDNVELTPIDLKLGSLKELGARWMIEMVDYIEENPDFIVNGFIKAGILSALNGKFPDDEAAVNSDDSEDDDSEDDDSEDDEVEDDDCQ